MKIGVTAGSFDLTHAGHFMMFAECKRYCDYLIVFLQTNPNIDRKEKNVPVQSLFERYTQLSSCSYIDEIIVYETEEDLYNFLRTTEFGVRFIGADWEGKKVTGDDIPGMKEKIVYNSREHSFSTSNLRKRVFMAEKEKISD